MKNKKTALILLLVFVLLIAGAYVLYNQLGSQIEAPQLATQSTEPPQETAPSEPETDSTDPAGSEPDAPDPTEPSVSLPDFAVYDPEGNPVLLSDFRGKPVVLNFWSSRCGPCQAEMPDFQKAYEDLGDTIQFVMVNVTDGSWDTIDSASDFLTENNYTFPVFFDTNGSAVYVFSVYSLPTTYFIDAGGNVIAYGKGAMDLETLMRGIAMINPSSQ